MIGHWQEWMVAVLLFLCAAGIARRVYGFIRGWKSKRYPCDHCGNACDYRGLYDARRPECKAGRKKKKKSCR